MLFFPGAWLPDGVLGRDCDDYGPPTSKYLFDLIRRYRRAGHSFQDALGLARKAINAETV